MGFSNCRAEQPSNAALVQFLQKACGDGKVFYVSNPGNAGDSLIAAATFQVLRQAGIRWKLLDHRQAPPKESILLYGGGGNFVRYYDSARRFIAAQHADARRLVLLPHTINANEDLLAELGPNVDLIARDRPSYEHIRTHAPKARHHLMHDIAIGTDLDDLRRGGLRLAGLPPSLRATARLMVRVAQRLRKPRPPAGRVLNAFRTDREAAGPDLPPDNYDLSAIYVGWTSPESFARIAARDFLSVIDHYDGVRTNRLHVAIGGAILGKKVYLYDNNYGKNKAIWEHSLKGRFQNVEWCS